MNCINRITRWVDETENNSIKSYEIEGDTITDLFHIFKLRGETLSYGIDLTISSVDDVYKASILLEKMHSDLKSISHD